MISNCPYLFVYGKLKSNQKNDQAEYLKKSAFKMGNGYVFGNIYLINNDYPGLILLKNYDKKVIGEVYKITDENIFQTLDKYENAWPLVKKDAEYKRIIEKVGFNDMVLTCWMYLYNWPVDEATQIKSGIF